MLHPELSAFKDLCMDLAALTDEVLARCDQLAAFSEEPDRLTRTFLSPPMRDVHACLTVWMEEAGLRVRTDAVGNVIGRRDSKTADAKIFAIGSHIDTVPNAGRYDGVLGVLLGIAAMKALKRFSPGKAVDVIAFSEEEGVRYARPFIGSRALCGSFDYELLTKEDAKGISLSQAISGFGLDPSRISEAAYPPGALAGYLEPHIEQGPVLEAIGRPLGVVEAIVGQSRHWVTFVGMAGHAGTQPMDLRRDALTAAAEFVSFVEKSARGTLGLRATVGSLVVQPGAVNVVPDFVRLSIDVRHANDAVRLKAVHELLDRAAGIALERGLRVELTPTIDQPAVPCNPEMTTRLADAVAQTGQPGLRLASGAGHDAMIMAEVCPVTMLFIRSPGGISHHPSESVEPHDVQLALEAMIRFLLIELQEG